VFKQVLDFDRGVEGERGVVRVHLLDDGERVGDGVEEVRVAEGDVFRAGLDELVDIGEDSLGLNEAEAAAVDGGDGAVGALVGATSAGFDVAGDSLFVADAEAGVGAEGWEAGALRAREVLTGEDGVGSDADETAEAMLVREGDEAGFVLAADDVIGEAVVCQTVMEEGGVEAVGGDR